MTARHFAENAQKDYARYVKNFTAFLGRSPDTATSEDLRLFQLHMTKTHVSPGRINATVVALRFFFKATLERDDLVRHLTLVREPRGAPTVLSPEEVIRLLQAAPGGGLALDGLRWIACRPGFFLPVRVLSRLFRRCFSKNSWPRSTPAGFSFSARTPTSPHALRSRRF